MQTANDQRWGTVRLEEFERRAVLDFGGTEQFDRIARLACRVLDVPVALMTFRGIEGQRLMSAIGLEREHVPLALSLCTDLALRTDWAGGTEPPFTLLDAKEVDGLAGHPLVAGPPHLRSCACLPLATSTGQCLGMLHAIDVKPRQFDEHARKALAEVAGIATGELQLRFALHQARRAETDSLRSEHHLRTILDHLFAFVGVLTCDGTLVEINRASLEAAGMTLEDVSGKPFWDCWWWAYSPEVQAHLRTAIEKAARGEASRYDVAIRVKDGTLTTIDFQIVPMRNARGLMSYLIPSGVDISDRIRAEREMRRLARIVEEAPDFIGSTDRDGRLTFLNPAGRRLLGLPDGEKLGELHLTSLHPETISKVISEHAVPQAVAYGEWSGETAILSADGSAIPILQVLIAHRGEDGQLLHLSTIARDISERKAAEEKLRESEARFRGTFDNAAIGMAHVDLDGGILEVNRRLLDIVGYARGELLALSCHELTHPQDLQVDLERYAALKRGEIDSYALEKRLFRKDGSFVWIYQTVAPQRSETGQILYSIVSVEDIDERKAVEDRLRLLVAELNHRVKNTLATIQALANQTLRHTRTREEFVTSFLGRIQALSVAHNQLTRSMWEGADLAALVRDQVTMNGAIDDDRVVSSGPSLSLPPQIALNVALILHELTTNAVKYGALSTDGGLLNISWSLATGSDHTAVLFEWVEKGGPPVLTPTTSGFGSLLMRQGLEQALGGHAHLHWHPAGFRAQILLPVPDYTRRKGYFRP